MPSPATQFRKGEGISWAYMLCAWGIIAASFLFAGSPAWAQSTPNNASGQSGPSGEVETEQPALEDGAGVWGPRNEDGLQCRLRASNSQWRLNEDPRFEIDVRNTGTRRWSIGQAQEECELELNGVWYQWSGGMDMPLSPFPPGDLKRAIPIFLGGSWRVKGRFSPLLLVQGKYTMRVAFNVDDFGKRPPTHSKPLSNPVSFTIGDGPIPESAPLPLTLQIKARIVEPDGKPFTNTTMCVWRADDGTAVKIRPKLPRSPYDRGPCRWEDRATGTTWDLIDDEYLHSDSITLPGLSAGDYRLTAWGSLGAQFQQVEPVMGLSGVIRLDGRQATTVETIRFETGPSLMVDVVDEATGAKVAGSELTLVRPDGLPVAPHGRGAIRTFAAGRFTYPHLRPGRYTLQVDCPARQYGDPNYVCRQTPPAIEIPDGRDTEVTVKLTSVPLSQAEIQQRWPWIITGKVTDASGTPLEDVTIYVNRNNSNQAQVRTGKDGSYTIRFAGNGQMYDEGLKRWISSPQDCVVSPFKPGLAERNMYEQGQVAFAELRPAFRNGRNKPEDFLLPNQPHQIDFVMAPAATVQGRFLDASGSPIADTYVAIQGDRVPPPYHRHGLAGAKTDRDGRFHIDSVPTDLDWWFETRIIGKSGHWEDIKSSPVSFARPEVYNVRLERRADESPDGRLDVKLN
jgi:protocatechuate 3,4-dioxygenase beta subunit